MTHYFLQSIWKMRSIFLFFALFLILGTSVADDYTFDHVWERQMSPKFSQRNVENTKQYWLDNAQKGLEGHLEKRAVVKKAKNVIFFLGDGMSLTTVAAARIYDGQNQGKSGEENKLSFEKFPVIGLANNYCVDSQVADSACSATAYLGGVKGNDGTIGVSGSVKRNDCEAMNDPVNQVNSILHYALEAKKSAGFVTTTRVTHASPSGCHAHIANRDWEADVDVAASIEEPKNCKDIAHQLINKFPGSDFQVIMGGGRLNFLPKDKKGRREDGLDLIDQWKSNHENSTPIYVQNRDELMAAVEKSPSHILGLFSDDHMEYNLLSDKKVQPTLEEMTEAAIMVLSRNQEGYFLFVEGGRIDHAHHYTYARMALDETVEMAKAVQKAISLTKESETLIVVSSDHSHTMTLSGYPSRGNPILKTSDTANGTDGIPYLTLSYANGPGYREQTDSNRPDVTQEDGYIEEDPKFQSPGLVPLDQETHGGEDIAVFAKGPFQHLFTGSYEQNLIPHLMAYAMCIGPGKHADVCTGGSSALAPSVLIFTLLAMHLLRRFIE